MCSSVDSISFAKWVAMPKQSCDCRQIAGLAMSKLTTTCGWWCLVCPRMRQTWLSSTVVPTSIESSEVFLSLIVHTRHESIVSQQEWVSQFPRQKWENLQAKSLWSSAATCQPLVQFNLPSLGEGEPDESVQESQWQPRIASSQQDWLTATDRIWNQGFFLEYYWTIFKRLIIIMAELIHSLTCGKKRWWSTYYCFWWFNCGRIWALVILSVIRTNDNYSLDSCFLPSIASLESIESIESIEFRLEIDNEKCRSQYHCFLQCEAWTKFRACRCPWKARSWSSLIWEICKSEPVTV